MIHFLDESINEEANSREYNEQQVLNKKHLNYIEPKSEKASEHINDTVSSDIKNRDGATSVTNVEKKQVGNIYICLMFIAYFQNNI